MFCGLIHQHSLNYSLLNREIRKHQKHKFKLNLIVTKVNVVRYQITCPWSLILLNAGEGGERISQADTLYFSLTDETNRRTVALSDRNFIYCRWWLYRDAPPGFGEQIAVGIELEIVAGFVKYMILVFSRCCHIASLAA